MALLRHAFCCRLQLSKTVAIEFLVSASLEGAFICTAHILIRSRRSSGDKILHIPEMGKKGG